MFCISFFKEYFSLVGKNLLFIAFVIQVIAVYIVDKYPYGFLLFLAAVFSLPALFVFMSNRKELKSSSQSVKLFMKRVIGMTWTLALINALPVFFVFTAIKCDFELPFIGLLTLFFLFSPMQAYPSSFLYQPSLIKVSSRASCPAKAENMFAKFITLYFLHMFLLVFLFIVEISGAGHLPCAYAESIYLVLMNLSYYTIGKVSYVIACEQGCLDSPPPDLSYDPSTFWGKVLLCVEHHVKKGISL